MPYQGGLGAAHKIEDALVFGFVIDPNGFEVRREGVTQDALHEVQVAVQERRRLGPLGLGADIVPQRGEILQVGLELLFRPSRSRRANDDSARQRAPVFKNDVPQAQALLFGRDLAGNADVMNRRHVDQVSSRQSDVRSDASAFVAQRLFGDLDKNLLTFLEQLRNLHGLVVPRPGRLLRETSASARTGRTLALSSSAAARSEAGLMVRLPQSIRAFRRFARILRQSGWSRGLTRKLGGNHRARRDARRGFVPGTGRDRAQLTHLFRTGRRGAGYVR